MFTEVTVYDARKVETELPKLTQLAIQQNTTQSLKIRPHFS